MNKTNEDTIRMIYQLASYFTTMSCSLEGFPIYFHLQRYAKMMQFNFSNQLFGMVINAAYDHNGISGQKRFSTA